MRLRPFTVVLTAAALATSLGLAGCGSAGEPPSSATSDPTTAATSAAPSTAAPTTTAPDDPTGTPTSDQQGNGDAEGDGEPATAGGGICSDLEAAAVGAALGGTVKGAAVPGGGCEFTQTDPRAPSASFVETRYSVATGGMDGAKTGATSAVEGEPEDISGVGTAAFLVTGTAFGGDSIQGAGAVRVGSRLINISLVQSTGTPRAKVRLVVLKLLKLAAARAR